MIRLFFVRLEAILAKEFVQMRRDRVTFAMMLGIPIMQLILFGYAINTDPKRLDAALLALGQDHYSRAIVSALEVSNYYRFVARPKTGAEAEALIQKGDVSFLVIIPSDFGARVDRGDKPQILVEADATDPAAASNAIGALERTGPARARARAGPRAGDGGDAGPAAATSSSTSATIPKASRNSSSSRACSASSCR